MKKLSKAVGASVLSVALLAGCTQVPDSLPDTARRFFSRARNHLPSNPTDRIREQISDIPSDLRGVASDVAQRAGSIVNDAAANAQLPEEPALYSATWAYREDEGGRTLMVVPAQWVRDTARGINVAQTQAATNRLFDELVNAEPEANSQAMLDQLRCHVLGVPDKDSWNLEPWRPDVGLAATIAALCNPS